MTEFTTKWGRWKPERRFNVDQVPCPCIIDQDRTYDEKGSSSVWVSQPGNGLDKRQFTLQLCICPKDSQPVPPAIIFRGKGKRVKDSELQAYDSRVHIYWQENSWLDSRVALEWVENTPAIDKTEDNVLFLDNLACQTTVEFHGACRRLANTLVYPLPADETDKCQPVDQGEGNMIKQLIGDQLDEFLEKYDNLDKWQSNLTASERRILITKWLGQAWEISTKTTPTSGKNFSRRQDF